MSTFEAWPKVPRWNREVIITEKIDGSNAAIIIEPIEGRSLAGGNLLGEVETAEGNHAVYAQSRTRLIRPGVGKEAGNDNFGFAAWVKENAEALVKLLGPGRHYGEWYGHGIQRGYGLDHRRFALFNTSRWNEGDLNGLKTLMDNPYLPVDVVPVLGVEPTPSEVDGSLYAIDRYLWELQTKGSFLVPGFMRPEGVVLFHTAANKAFKILLEGDESPKGSSILLENDEGRKG